MNLADNLAATASTMPGRIVIKADQLELSSLALDDLSSRGATWLQSLGVGPGDRVGLMLPNIPEFAILYYAILRTGAIVVPMNPLFREREVQYYLADSDAHVVFAAAGTADQAEPGAAAAGVPCILVDSDFQERLMRRDPTPAVVDRAADDTAVILYTSGTTGKPKGAELTHRNLSSNVEAIVRMFDANADDVIFGALPLFHSFGQMSGLNAAVRAGATLTMMARFDPTEALEMIQRDKVTIMEGVPTMYMALLQHPDRASYDVSSVRVSACGGASLPVEVLRGFEREFSTIMLEGYGLSETSPVASFNQLGQERKPGSIGTPIPGVEMRVVDSGFHDVEPGEVGEIAIKGPNVMKGYWQRPDATAEVMRGDWFLTGDLARCDDDGFFFIVDRAKDLIIRGGYNVYPREVEEVLYEHPDVAEAAVIGVPEPRLGEEVAAAIALMPGSTVSTEEISEFVRERLAAYKCPRIIWFFDDGLPKGPTGKILKREIAPPAND